MAIHGKHQETEFGVGDVVRVHQRITEPGKSDEKKSRIQIFEGTVIKIKGSGSGKSFTVRRIGAQNIGIEQIYPFASPLLEKVEVSRLGKRGARRAKLYYIRDKSKREIESIFSRAKRREAAKLAKSAEKTLKPKSAVAKKTTKKAPAKKSSLKKSSDKVSAKK